MNIGYITLLTTEEYLTGLSVTIASLQATGTKIPIYCIVTPDISEEVQLWLVQNFNISIIQKECISAPMCTQELFIKKQNHKVGHWNNTFSKLHIFDLEQFDKIVYLDSDLFVTQNIDDLFTRPHMSAVLDSMYIKTPQDFLEHEGDEYFNYFNSGVMVIEPNHQVFLECLDFVENLKPDRFWGDQNVLGKIFCNWKNQRELKLPMEYNCLVNILHQYEEKHWFNPLNIKVWHFVDEKPWKIDNNFLDQCSTLKKQLFIDYLKFVQIIQHSIDIKNKEKTVE